MYYVDCNLCQRCFQHLILKNTKKVTPVEIELTIYGGAVHFSRDSLRLPDGTIVYGLVTTFSDTGWNHAVEGCFVADLSQETGAVRVTREFFDQVNIGDVVAVMRVHVCLTVNESDVSRRSTD